MDIWAVQFYQARSEISHEGRTQKLRFVATDSAKKSAGDSYRSLLSYGRQIFRLCVGCLLFGANLTRESGLEEKFITNQERFERICRELSDEALPASERLLGIAETVDAIARYRFVSESGLKIETLLSAAKRVANALLASGAEVDASLRMSLQKLIDSSKSRDHYEELDALRALGENTSHTGNPGDTSEQSMVLRLLAVVWGYVFQHYFWITSQRSAHSSNAPEGRPPG